MKSEKGEKGKKEKIVWRMNLRSAARSSHMEDHAYVRSWLHPWTRNSPPLRRILQRISVTGMTDTVDKSLMHIHWRENGPEQSASQSPSPPLRGEPRRTATRTCTRRDKKSERDDALWWRDREKEDDEFGTQIRRKVEMPSSWDLTSWRQPLRLRKRPFSTEERPKGP